MKQREKTDKIFQDRMAKKTDALRGLYMELYGNDSMFFELCDQLHRFYEERSSTLKALDRKREADPGWYKKNDMLGMMFYIDNFAGNMKGVESKLDYLEKNNIPFKVRGSKTDHFTDEVSRDIKCFLRLAKDASDTAAFSRIYYKLSVPIGKDKMRKAVGRGGNVFDSLTALDKEKRYSGKIKSLKRKFNFLKSIERADEALDYIINDIGYGAYVDKRAARRRDAMRQKLNVLMQISRGGMTPDELQYRFEVLEKLLEDGGCDIENSNLTLSTIHSAKGQEFERVCMVDVVEGILPEENKTAPGEEADNEEDKRIFYVGITRAKNKLEILSLTGREKVYPISRYLRIMKKTIEGESEPQTEEYREGSSVEHNLFGRGLVLSIDDGIALIDFEGLGKKRISLAHCKAMRVI